MKEYSKYLQKLYKGSSKELYKELKNSLVKDKLTFVVTANPETLTYAFKDEDIAKMLSDKSIIKVADGIGIVKAANILDIKVEERIPGIEIAEKLLDYANELGKSIYFLGAKQEVLDNLKIVLENKYPNIKILGMVNGYVENKDKEFEKIVKLSPDIVLVALGIPHQEKLIYKHLNKFKKGIFVGVGGSFDVISGSKKRAPKFFQKFNIEWLYRITKEPKRIKRFYHNNIKFILEIKKEKKK